MKEKIQQLIQDSIAAKQKLLVPEQIEVLERAATRIINVYRSGRKVLVCGNGGSAADAQHLAAELVCRFEKNRVALPALALTTDTSILTATGNDFSFEDIFSRQVEALANPGDILIAISTSGNSPNVLKAAEQARSRQCAVIAFTGENGGRLGEKADLCFRAPSAVTARIQECHVLAVHLLCALVEDALFGKQ